MLTLPESAIHAACAAAAGVPVSVIREVLNAALPFMYQIPSPEREAIRSPRGVFALMAPRLEHLPVEEMHVIFLDTQHRTSGTALITRGLLTTSLCHPREIFREAIGRAAAGIILVHNHPSGDPTPSPEDKAVTNQLSEAGRLLGIPVFDHVIIGTRRYTSFAEAGLL